MKKLLLWLAILLPTIAFGQVNGTIQKTTSTGTVRGSFGSAGLDTIAVVKSLATFTNGQTMIWDSTLKKFVAASAGITGVAAFGSTPNANGASISGNTLTLQPASASFPGGVTTGTQTFAGNKTFTDSLSGSKATFTGVVNSQTIGDAFSITGGTLDWRAFGISNVGGLARVGLENNTGGGIITGSTGYDMAVRGSSGISFSGNGGTSLHARLSNTGVLTGTFSGELTGNASTATTLATTRTIWGQNFNGSANVTGALTGVTGITTSGGYTQSGTTANTLTGALTGTNAALTSGNITSSAQLKVSGTGTNGGFIHLEDDGAQAYFIGVPDGVNALRIARNSATGASLLDISNTGATFSVPISAANLASGTDAPTLVAVTNVLTYSVSKDTQWLRVGNYVSFSLEISALTFTGAGASRLDFEIPVPSNFSNGPQLVGTVSVAQTANATNMYVQADATDDRGSLVFTSNGSAASFAITGHYLIQ